MRPGAVGCAHVAEADPDAARIRFLTESQQSKSQRRNEINGGRGSGGRGSGSVSELGCISSAGRWFWRAIHRQQLEEMAELRRDVDALLHVLDHWVTLGVGDKQRQFDYMTEVLTARGKRGISGADMRVASLINDDTAYN